MTKTFCDICGEEIDVNFIPLLWRDTDPPRFIKREKTVKPRRLIEEKNTIDVEVEISVHAPCDFCRSCFKAAVQEFLREA